MKAFVLHKKGATKDAFRLDNLPSIAISAKQVKIFSEAFGLNYADVMARRGLYREAPSMPSVIGYEVVGKITEVGNEISTDLIGKRVLAFCRFGGYGQEVVSEEHAFIVIDDMDAGKALALATQFVTAIYMVERSANVQEGERVLIHAAAGGVGTALIQLCKLRNAIVFAKVSSAEKVTLVKELGADFSVNYSESDYAMQLSDLLRNERLDVSFNPVAGKTFKKDWKLLGTGGRLVLFGGSDLSKGKWGIFSVLNFLRNMGTILPIGLMMRSKSIAGVNMLKVGDYKPLVLQYCMRRAVQLFKEGKINPVIGKTYTESEFFQAHEDLESGKSMGKLVVIWSK